MAEETRAEELLTKLLNGETIDDFEPRSDFEVYLKNCINGIGTAGLPDPRSRMSALLWQLAKKIGEGGSGGGTDRSLKEFITKRGCAYLFTPGDLEYEYPYIDDYDTMLKFSDTSHVEDFIGMFYSNYMITKAPLFDTSEGINFRDMFLGCSSLTEVPLFDLRNAYCTASMFAYCESLTEVPLFNTRQVEDMCGMFDCCISLTEVPLFDTGRVVDMSYMFAGCESLTEVPLFDTGDVGEMDSMFNNCTSLTEVPLFDMSNVGNTNYMFRCCTSLTAVPSFNYRNIVNMQGMFEECTSLTEVPLIDLNCSENIGNMFYGCTSLTEVNFTGEPTRLSNIDWLFKSCTSLTTVTGLNLKSFGLHNTRISDVFTDCESLTTCYIKNIGRPLVVGSGTSYGHLLTLDSLVYLISELCTASGSRTLTIGSANLEKIESVYVRLIDITDEMRADDDWIDKKYPCEICESTDEGAMLLEDYAAMKNWSLA